MKRAVENGLYALGGLLLGGGLSFFVTVKLFGKKIEDTIRADAMTEANYWKDKYKEVAGTGTDKPVTTEPIPDLKTVTPPTTTRSSLNDPTIGPAGNKVTKTEEPSSPDKYHKHILSEHYAGVTDEDMDRATMYDDTSAQNVIADALENELDIEPKHIKVDYPTIISSGAFNDPGDDDYVYEYPKITLDYFEGDKVLCVSGDSNGPTSDAWDFYEEWEKIPDMEAVVGKTWLNNIGQDKSIAGDTLNWPEDMAYVRNDKLGIDFEIIRDKDSYQHYVVELGRL